jgi:hypothetical protein
MLLKDVIHSYRHFLLPSFNLISCRLWRNKSDECRIFVPSSSSSLLYYSHHIHCAFAILLRMSTFMQIFICFIQSRNFFLYLSLNVFYGILMFSARNVIVRLLIAHSMWVFIVWEARDEINSKIDVPQLPNDFQLLKSSSFCKFCAQLKHTWNDNLWKWKLIFEKTEIYLSLK